MGFYCRCEIFRNLKSGQWLMPDYNDQSKLIKLACFINYAKKLEISYKLFLSDILVSCM